MFLNEFDADHAVSRYCGHPILGPATSTLAELIDWTNENSDGWAYWPKPSRAARKLQELIGTGREYYDDPSRASVTADDLKRAYTPIRAFATKHGATLTFHLPA